MRRSLAAGLAAFLLLALAVPVAAHTNDVEADTQVSAGGTVRIESALILDGGYVAVHRNGSDGRPGEPIGHVAVGQGEFRQGFAVRIDAGVWAEWDEGRSRTVWVVLHREESGPGFDPAEDPIQRNAFGRPATERIGLARGDGETSVVAERFEPQRVDGNAVTVSRVALATPGHVAVRVEADSGTGPVVGSTPLPAGVSRNVSVAVDGSVFAEQGRSLTLVAQAYAGNGTLEAARQVRAGGRPVGSAFDIERTGPIDADTNGPASTVTGTPASVTTTESRIVTPARTTAATAVETTTRQPATPTATTGESGPGMGVAAALTATLLLLVAGLRSRSRSR